MRTDLPIGPGEAVYAEKAATGERAAEIEVVAEPGRRWPWGAALAMITLLAVALALLISGGPVALRAAGALVAVFVTLMLVGLLAGEPR